MVDVYRYPNYFPNVSVYESDGVTARLRNGQALTSVPLSGEHFGTLLLCDDSPPSFLLTPERLVGVGQLTIAMSETASDFGSCPIAPGDVVVFSPEPGVEWARLIAKDAARSGYDRWTIPLEGQSAVLFGRPAVELDPDDGHVLGYETSWMPTPYADPPGLPPEDEAHITVGTDGTVTFTFHTPGMIVAAILGNELHLGTMGTDFAGAYWWLHRRIYQNPLGDWGAILASYTIRPDTNISDVFTDLARMAEGASGVPTVWGIGNGIWGDCTGTAGSAPNQNDGGLAFCFAPLPTGTMMTWNPNPMRAAGVGPALEWATVLQFVGWTPGPYYNVCEATGAGGLRVVVKDDAAIAARGGICSRARAQAPSIGSTIGLELFARAWLRRYAIGGPIVAPIPLAVPSASGLPWPWGGWARIVDNDGADVAAAQTIQSVKVTLGSGLPTAEVQIGEMVLPTAFGPPGRAGCPGTGAFGLGAGPGLSDHEHSHDNWEELEDFPPHRPSEGTPDAPWAPVGAAPIVQADRSVAWQVPAGSVANWQFLDGSTGSGT